MSELEHASAEAIKQLMDWLEGAGAYVAEQAPELAQQIVAFGLAWNGLAVVTAIIMLVVVWVVYAKTFNKFKDDDELSVPITLVSVAVTSVCVFVLSTCMKPLLQAYFAPKFYIIEVLKDFVS